MYYLVQRSSCLECYETKNSDPETALGFDESKLTKQTCDADSVCFVEDIYTEEGNLSKFN